MSYRAVIGTDDVGYSRDSATTTATSVSGGLATLTFIIGVTYEIWRGTMGAKVRYVASATAPPETLGAP